MNPLKTDAAEITSKKAAMALLHAMQEAKAGEDGEYEPISEEEAIIRYARRALALFKDQHRVKAGKVATVYTPRVTDGLAKPVQKAVAALVEALPVAEPKPAKEPKAKEPKAKKASKKIERPAKEPKKIAKPAKASKPAKVAASAGGAAVEF